jgi:hypothetical protein
VHVLYDATATLQVADYRAAINARRRRALSGARSWRSALASI